VHSCTIQARILGPGLIQTERVSLEYGDRRITKL
jgi:hypothetical protein